MDEVLDLVGLAGAARKRAGKFSLGMAQRLGIAAALLGDPPVLLLDEPVNGLDPAGIHWIRDLLRSLAGQGRVVFVSSHLISEIALLAEHLVVIGQGRLLADTSVAELSAGARVPGGGVPAADRRQHPVRPVPGGFRPAPGSPSARRARHDRAHASACPPGTTGSGTWRGWNGSSSAPCAPPGGPW